MSKKKGGLAPDMVMVELTPKQVNERLELAARQALHLIQLRERKTEMSRAFTQAIKETERAIEDLSNAAIAKCEPQNAQLPLFAEIPGSGDEDDEVDDSPEPRAKQPKPRASKTSPAPVH